MKNTKFRRRALVSSVAMLLVALVALGSATFAWFTSSTTATASGISVKTIKASELVISKSDLQWGTTVNYAHSSDAYTPVSTNNGTAWFEANAETKNSYAKKSTDEFKSVTAAANHYYTEALNIANKGDAAVNNVTITISGLTSNYARLAIFEVTANNGTTHANSDETFAQCVYDTDGAQYAAVTGATTTSNITPKTSTTISVGNLAGKTGSNELGDVKYYKFYIWFEGQDQQCFDANAGAAFGDIQFSVSGTTATD